MSSGRREAFRDFNKIFCIGQNKTGTSSLHQAFQVLGLSSLSWAPASRKGSLKDRYEMAQDIHRLMEENKKRGFNLLSGIDDYDAYSDLGLVTRNYRLLDSQYPGSLFIYTDRDTDSWLESRVKHVVRKGSDIASGRVVAEEDRIQLKSWRESKEAHKLGVLDYFSSRPDSLLVMNIMDGDGYDVLCPFLGCAPIEEAFPFENRAP